MFKKIINFIFKCIICPILIAYCITHFIVAPVKVKGNSMYPTLHDNDYGVSFIFDKKVERFDIVVLKHDKDLLIKRIIGLPNETIAYKENKLYINGVLTNENYLDSSVLTEDFEITLQDDEYFCLGDNRQVSLDSRTYGPFSKKDIFSRHIFLISPFKGEIQ